MSITKLEKDSEYDTINERVSYFKGANWAELEGKFTPNELRKIARDIEKQFKKVPKSKS